MPGIHISGDGHAAAAAYSIKIRWDPYPLALTCRIHPGRADSPKTYKSKRAAAKFTRPFEGAVTDFRPTNLVEGRAKRHYYQQEKLYVCEYQIQ